MIENFKKTIANIQKMAENPLSTPAVAADEYGLVLALEVVV